MPYKLSPSTLKIYAECPRCFWLHIKENKKRPIGFSPSLPTGIDRVMKNHFDKYRKEQQLPPELRHLSDIHLIADADKIKQWRDNPSGLAWTDKKGNALRGSIDELLIKDDGTLIVLDYKTSGKPFQPTKIEQNQLQLDAYNFILSKKGFKTEDYAYLLFLSPNYIQPNGDVALHKELIQMPIDASRAEKTFKNALELLEKPTPDYVQTCMFCQWNR